MKLCLTLFHLLLVGILCVNTNAQIRQQPEKQIRLLITDSNDGVVTTIDTLLQPQVEVDLVLEKLGYGHQDLAKSQNTKKGRRVTIATEEILKPMPQKNLQLDWETINPAPTQEMIPINTETYTHLGGGGTRIESGTPNIKISVADLDLFDLSALEAVDPSLKDAKRLAITNFSVRPDFKEELYRFTFAIPNGQYAEFKIYDVLGHLVTEETITGFYDKTHPKFTIYTQGTYLVLIKQDGKKYTQKITFG